jgi:hypothetical protein
LGISPTSLFWGGVVLIVATFAIIIVAPLKIIFLYHSCGVGKVGDPTVRVIGGSFLL